MNRTVPTLLGLTLLTLAPLRADEKGMPADCPLHAQHMAAAAATGAVASPMVIPQPTPTPSPYADEVGRDLAALSPDEVAALRAGSGHGMALPAELHHYPGPRHVLDLAADLQLTAAQSAALATIYDRMHNQALGLGEKILAGEAGLDGLFRDGQATLAEVERLTSDLGRLRGALRAAHLGAHLATRALLSADQVARYDAARGYLGGEPTAHAGHGTH